MKDNIKLRAVGLGSARGTAGGENDADDEAVQGERLGENEDKDHAGKQLGLLRVGAHAGVADDANGHASSQAREPARKPRGKVSVPLEERVAYRVDCWSRGCI